MLRPNERKRTEGKNFLCILIVTAGESVLMDLLNIKMEEREKEADGKGVGAKAIKNEFQPVFSCMGSHERS